MTEELYGQWWHPMKPEHRVGGVLLIERQVPVSLTTIGGVFYDGHGGGDPREAVTEKSGRAALLHGVANGRPVTLIDCVSVKTTAVIAANESVTQRIQPGAVVVGVHLYSVDDVFVAGLSVEIDNLTDWSAMRTMEPTFGDQASFGAAGYSFASPTRKVAESDGTRIELIPVRSGSWWPEAKSDGRYLDQREWTCAVFTFGDPQTWECGITAPRRLQDLVTFATRVPCSVRARTLLVVDDTGRTGSVELYVRAGTPVEASETTDPHDYLFDLSSLAFEDVYRSWAELVEQVKSGVDVLLSLTYDRPSFYENTLFNAGAAAEAFHRGYFPGSRTMEIDADQHKSMLEKIRSVLNAEERRWVGSRLENRPGLKERLLELPSLADQTAVEELVTDRATWAKWLKDSRNAVAHLELARLDSIPYQARYRLADITQYLLNLVVLNQLGIGAAAQQRAVRELYWYQAQQFGLEVKDALTGR